MAESRKFKATKPRPIKLHEVRPGQGLASGPLQRIQRRRLNVFAGRSLGETEFDILQAYTDGRLDELLDDRAPGVLDGLSSRLIDVDDAPELVVQPGLAVGADGRVIRLHFAMNQSWSVQVADYKERKSREIEPIERVHGVYFLTVRREVERVDRSAVVSPCNRTEPDPLRDERLETVVSLSLQPIISTEEIVDLAETDKLRCINRILASLLSSRPFDAGTGAVPIAMLAARDDDILWLDSTAGRVPAAPDPMYRVLLAHTHAAFSERFAGLDAEEFAAALESFDLEFLPAVGQLPRPLLTDFSSVNLPQVAWLPARMQIEMVPVAESVVDATLARELPRGVIDLAGGTSDRLRLMLAVPDVAYRPDLLDLPDADHESENDVYRRGQIAHAAWESRQDLYEELFAGLTEAEGEELAIPDPVAPPLTPEAFFTELLSRDWIVGGQGATNLPAPYTDTVPPPPSDYTPPAERSTAEAGKLRELLDLQAEIEQIEQMGDDLDKLLRGFTDVIHLQRQHLDSLSISFSRLAGGIPGDGTGLGVARLLPNMTLQKLDPNNGGGG